MGNDRSWMAPLTGVGFIVLLIVGFSIGGEPPDVNEDSASEIVKFYVDNETSVIVGAALAGVAATLFVFFGGVLRRALRDAEGDRGVLSAVAFAGAIVFAVGVAIDSMISFALAETAEDIDPTATQALMALWDNDFMPIAVGLQLLLLATGISVLRHGALPKWVGVLAIVVALFVMTPVWFVGLIGSALTILIISILLTMRGRARAGGETPAV